MRSGVITALIKSSAKNFIVFERGPVGIVLENRNDEVDTLQNPVRGIQIRVDIRLIFCSKRVLSAKELFEQIKHQLDHFMALASWSHGVMSEYRFAGGTPPGGRGGRGGLCSTALVTGALLAAVAVLAVASLAFYMGALKPDNGEPMMSFEGSMRVTKGDVYGGPPGSASWKERARRYGAALRQIFTGPSSLKQAFAGTLVTGFGDRRLDVHFRLYLDRRKIPSTINNIEETLKDILLQDLRSKRSAFGQVKIDPASIMIKRDLEHTYHSESYVKEAMNESAIINSPKQVTQQNPKDKILQSRVGVVRKTTIKPNQGTKKRVSNTDDLEVDEEHLPVVQGSFQITKTEADITENKQNDGANRQEEKHSNKLKTTTKVPTTRKVPTTSPKPKPFTIMSTLNVKQNTDEPPKKITRLTTVKPIIPTRAPTRITSTTILMTTTSEASNNNISQILLDLLSQENHYKDVPKIDSLFTVPHVIDNEPWRPITRPYDYHTTIKPIESSTEQNAEDRIGVAEVVDDISALESILSAPPPSGYNEKLTFKPGGIHSVDSNQEAEIHVPKPVYTSFTVPTFAPTLKDTETLGLSYPKPHPIPVDKISTVVEDISHENLNDEDDGKPVQRPPKDKTTSVSINVVKIDHQEENTKKILVEGTSIIKKTNDTKYLLSNPASSTIQTYTEIEPTSAESTTIQTTKRPNNKVSVVPSTETPYHTWELINSSTIANNSVTKTSPEKFYNDTLQAIITKNEALKSNATPKFPGRLSLLKNLTDIIKRYTQSTPEKSSNISLQKDNETNKNLSNTDDSMEKKENNYDILKYEDDMESTTSSKIITLLPAKSNLGMNRPLRPRPIIKEEINANDTTGELFELNDKNVTVEQISEEKIDVENSNNMMTPSTIKTFEEDDQTSLTNVTKNIKLFESKHNNNASSGNRLPKTNSNVNNPTVINNTFATHSNNNNVSSNIPEGTYRISYHVTGSVSSKQANKTKSLPAYELTLEPDVVLEIPINQSNPLTVDKLRQLANLATISDSDNTTSYRPGGVISTKAIPSSYALNQAGFKILTKTYNKEQSLKQGDNAIEKNHLDKSSEKPSNELHNGDEKDDTSDGILKEVQACDNATSFHCSEGACIALTARCNRLLDCKDGEDERGCSCADYLRADYAHSKICDGVVDCWDYSDEKHCDWCGEGQYVCANARQCVEAARVCDGTPDCPLGDDEKSCVALADRVDDDVVNYNEEGVEICLNSILEG
ncbi:Prolow-density lipoprotein receptor-related protein 1 [Eumeta japonica]|uniref:Prolow-density lipoprotein receptor-related protein 1 n=1 Tax=Eumeta variegata TaxID=151549 RepID=A0A4C1YIS0_EUMVA|nr:Prolow-density lipoprotein receptor-related protein 1 [Eumeta japonica]